MGITSPILAPENWQAALAALDWQAEMGMSDWLQDAPVNRYDLPERLERPAVETPAQARPAQARPAPASQAQAPKADAVAIAQQAANAADSLDALRAAIAAFDFICEEEGGLDYAPS